MIHLNGTDTFDVKCGSSESITRENLIRQWLFNGKSPQGIQFNEEDEVYGWTPVHWAAYFGKLERLQAITMQKPIIDQATKSFTQTPLHFAAFSGQIQCVQWLIGSGADVNKQDCLLETPLHKAARAGNVECVDFLIKNGADVSIPNKDGLTAERICFLCKHVQCYDYLHHVNTFKGVNGCSHGASDAEWMLKGINGGRVPQPYQNGGNVLQDMDVDVIPVIQSEGNDLVRNGICHLLAGRKRSYHGGINDNVIKRMKASEESSNGFGGTCHLQMQTPAHSGNANNLHLNSTILADMHGS